jgi:hypothetical protein
MRYPQVFSEVYLNFHHFNVQSRVPTQQAIILTLSFRLRFFLFDHSSIFT